MMRLIVILALAFFAVTFLISIFRRILKSGGIPGMNDIHGKRNAKTEDKSKIIDAKYEEIK